jgi:general secretion pathway protein A
MPTMPEVPFGVSENPFVEGHDARFVCPSRAHREVVTRLLRGIENREPFMMVTGLPGVGKTVAVRAALAEAGPHRLVLIAASPSLSLAKLRERTLAGFAPNVSDAPGPARSAGGMDARLLAVRSGGQMAFLVVDEAQNLSGPLFEELRVLSNLEADGHNLLQIILVGLPALEDALAGPGCGALRQRIAVRCRLGALSEDETEGYIRHRVSVAGGDAEALFSSASCQAVHRLAHGIPREINLVAGEALLLAQSAGECTVTAGHIAGAKVLLGFRSVVNDSQSVAEAAAEPAEAQPEEALPRAGGGAGPVECEEPETLPAVLRDIDLPVSSEAPGADHAEAPQAEHASVSQTDHAEVPAVASAESAVAVPCGTPPPSPPRHLGAVADVTPASLEAPEVKAWLDRFLDPNGPPRIGSRLAVLPTELEAREARDIDSVGEQPAAPTLLHPRAGLRSAFPRRRSPRGDRSWKSATWMVGTVLLLAVGGLVLTISGRSLRGTRSSAQAVVETTPGMVERARPARASMERPQLVPAASMRSAERPAAPAAPTPMRGDAPRPPASAVPAPVRAEARIASAPAAASVARAVERNAPKPPPPSPPTRAYGVEVATFIVESRAVQERDRLAAAISLPCRIVNLQEDGDLVYSIVVGPVASSEEAERLSVDLSQRRLVSQARVVRWASTDSTRR